jgi:hypothetical protein
MPTLSIIPSPKTNPILPHKAGIAKQDYLITHSPDPLPLQLKGKGIKGIGLPNSKA